MKIRTRSQLLFVSVLWLGLSLLTVPGCSPGQVSSTNTPLPSPTSAMACEQELVLPQITEIQPAQPRPGEEINVIGSGGYLQDSCGGFIEGSREFTLYLDREAAGSLSCYVNHCEGRLVLPAALATGLHCLSVKPEQCAFEFRVTSE